MKASFAFPILLGVVVAACTTTPPASAPSSGPEQPGSSRELAPMSTLGPGSYDPRPITPGEPTGTFVGGKVVQLRGDLNTLQRSIGTHNDQLQRIRADTRENAEAFHTIVGQINARLQVGTTPGNPILSRQLADAQAQLSRVDANVTQLTDLATRIASDSSFAAFLLDAVRASYNISGAVEEDHRQLAIIEDEVNRSVVLIDRLLNEISDDISRQTDYVARERRNVQTLALAVKRGEIYGSSLENRQFTPVSAAAASEVADGRPMVVIRFDRPDVAYEQPLYNAMSEAIARRPDASFEVRAVSPGGRAGASQTSARRAADRVVRTLTEMGVPSSRIRLTSRPSADAASDEVHIFVM